MSATPQEDELSLTQKIIVDYLADDIAYIKHCTSFDALTSDQRSQMLIGTVELADKIAAAIKRAELEGRKAILEEVLRNPIRWEFFVQAMSDTLSELKTLEGDENAEIND